MIDFCKGGDDMKVIVDQDLCISCGLCVETCPDIFDWNDDGKADVQVDPVPADREDCAKEAMENCPVDAIQEV